MTIKIQQATISDTTQISELAMLSKAHWGYSVSFLKSVKEELTYTANDIDQNPTYIGVCEGRLVGFYQLIMVTQEQVELEALFIHPKFIRTGNGTQLFKHACKKAVSLNYNVMIIQSDPYAEEFYLKLGCIKIGQKPSLSIPGRSLPLFKFNLDH